MCGFGGVLSYGLTHTLVTPLDLVKCRLQVDKAKKMAGNNPAGAAGNYLAASNALGDLDQLM